MEPGTVNYSAEWDESPLSLLPMFHRAGVASRYVALRKSGVYFAAAVKQLTVSYISSTGTAEHKQLGIDLPTLEKIFVESKGGKLTKTLKAQITSSCKAMFDTFLTSVVEDLNTEAKQNYQTLIKSLKAADAKGTLPKFKFTKKPASLEEPKEWFELNNQGDIVSQETVENNSKNSQVSAPPTDKVHKALWPEESEMEMFDVSELGTAPLIPLRDAKLLYQPTAGTSIGSRYYLIASSGDLKISCRYKLEGDLSVRCEGTALKKGTARKALSDIGFSNCSDQYGSFHVSAKTRVDATKIIGSIIFCVPSAIDTPWDTAPPNMEVIYGK